MKGGSSLHTIKHCTNVRVLYVAGIALDRKDFDLSLSTHHKDFSALKLFKVSLCLSPIRLGLEDAPKGPRMKVLNGAPGVLSSRPRFHSLTICGSLG